MMFLKKIKDISDLIRTELPFAAGVCVILGQVLALGGFPSIGQALLGFLTGFFISGAAMITNDYFDLEVDRVNHPDRPLPSGRITVAGLWALTLLFTISGLICAGLLGFPAFIIAAVIWVIGLLYNWKFKESGLPGNMMVSISVASTFIAGGVSVGGLMNGLVWVFGMLAFLFDLAEEIAADAMDAEGDKMRGSRSIAIKHGKRFALRLSALIYAVFISLSFLPFLLGWLGTVYLALVSITDIAVIFLVFRLFRSETVQEGKRMTRYLYLVILFFVLSFIISIWSAP